MKKKIMTNETKRKIKKLFIYCFACVLLLKDAIAFADTNGKTESLLDANENMFTEDDLAELAVSINRNDGKPVLEIPLPVIPDNYVEEGVEVEYKKTVYNDILKILSTMQNNQMIGTNFNNAFRDRLALAENWHALSNYFDACENGDVWNHTMDEDDIKNFFNDDELDSYEFVLSAKKEGHSLIGYAIVDTSEKVWIGSHIRYSVIKLEPIFFKIAEEGKLEPYYGAVTSLKEGDKLMPGSLVYATDSEYPLFFVKISPGVAQIVGQNASSWAADDPNGTFGNANNFLVYRVTDEYTPYNTGQSVKVLCWEVVKKWSVEDFKGEEKGQGGYTQTSTSGGTPASSDYVRTGNVMIQLSPITEDEMQLNNPKVSVEDGFLLKLTTTEPSAKYGSETDYSDITDDIVNKFYVTKDPLDAEDVETFEFTVYDEQSTNRILHEGEYRVFHQATYTDQDETISSDIEYDVIVVKPPIVESPTITIDSDDVSYQMNGVSTEDDQNAYSTVKNDQKLVHICTQDPDFEAESLLNPPVQLEAFAVKDTLKAGYNKICAYSALTIGASVKVDGVSQPAVTYYSEPAEEVVNNETDIPQKSPTITFEPNGGICDVKSKTVNKGEKYGDLPEPTYGRNVFLGWFDELTGGNQITSDSIKQDDQDQTLYAHWRAADDPDDDDKKGDDDPDDDDKKGDDDPDDGDKKGDDDPDDGDKRGDDDPDDGDKKGDDDPDDGDKKGNDDPDDGDKKGDDDPDDGDKKDTDNPDDGNKKTDGTATAVKTGDDAPILMWGILLMLGMAWMIISIWRGIRFRRR